MKRILPSALLFLAACAAATKEPHDVPARVTSIRQEHDLYADGRFAFYAVVDYEVLSSGRMIERVYVPGSRELESLVVGQVVKLIERGCSSNR